jgi:hypothetical protein
LLRREAGSGIRPLSSARRGRCVPKYPTDAQASTSPPPGTNTPWVLTEGNNVVDIPTAGPEEPAPARIHGPAPVKGDRNNRMYRCSDLPVLTPIPIVADDAVSRMVLLSELNEAATAWRMLTDVRFKLLALLPPVSALALTAIVSPKGVFEEADSPVRVAAAAFGFLVVLGLRIYDRRNDDLYNDLISRARRAEYELGIDTGVFRGRRKPGPLWNGRFKIPRRLTALAMRADLIGGEGDAVSIVKHGIALKMVYGTVLAAWLLAGVSAAAGWVP